MPRRLRELRPQAIVLEAPEDTPLWPSLRELPPAVVIRVSLEDDVMDVYDSHQSVQAAPESLLDAISAGLRRRRA